MTERVVAVIGILLMVIAVAVVFFIGPFGMFEDPEIETLDRQCDPKGLKQAEVQSFTGNAVTNESIHVVIYPGCEDNKKDDTGSPVFVIEKNPDDNVHVKWNTSDTLEVEYPARLKIYRQLKNVTLGNSSLTVHIRYHERPAQSN